jgi:hypothetical protein
LRRFFCLRGRKLLTDLAISPRPCISDGTAADEISLLHIRRDGTDCLPPAPRRLLFELLDVQVICTAPTVAFLIANPQESAIPVLFCFERYPAVTAIPRTIPDQFPITFLVWRNRKEHMITLGTLRRFRLWQDYMAFGAEDDVGDGAIAFPLR